MSLSRYSVRQLDALSAVADTLSFTGAAQRLSLTPSAVSQLVLELERLVGFKLFERSTRRVSLTAAGKEFLGVAEPVLKHLRLAEESAAELRRRTSGLVRIAAPMVIASAMLPSFIGLHSRLHPKVAVRIRDAPVEKLVDMVASGDVDLAVGPDRPTAEDVSRTPLFESPWVLWCSRDHPLAARRTIRWREVRQHALVTAGRDHERSVKQMRLGLPEQQRITPIDVVDNISTALGIAAAGLAATLSPAYVGIWAGGRWGLEMRRVVAPEVMRQVCLYQPLRREVSTAVAGFSVALAQWMRDEGERLTKGGWGGG